MADKTINQLTAATGITDSSLFVIEQNSTAKSINWGLMKNYISPGVAAQYSTSATYNVGDYVIYNDSLYRCKTAITTAEAWTAAHWTATVMGNDVTALGYAEEVNASLLSAELQNDTSAKSVLLSGILNGSNVWASLATGQHNLFPVNSGDTVRIKANSNTGTVYAVLRSYRIPVASAAPDFSQQSGYTTRLTLTKNTETTFTVPSDGHYLYVTYGNSGTVNFPAILTVNGRNNELFSIKKFQSDAEFQESDFKVVGTTLVQKKTTGVTLTGSMTIYYGTPLFLEMLKTYLNTGALPYFTIQVTNDDPSSSVGTQTVALYNCKLSKVPVAMLDADAEWLEEEVSFSYTNLEVLNAFHAPATLGA